VYGAAKCADLLIPAIQVSAMNQNIQIEVKREGTFCSYVKEENGVKTVYHCRDIRGGMVWPTLNAPAYFCIFAQQTELNVKGRLPLVLLAEGENTLPHTFFRDLIAKGKEYCCRHFYVDFTKENRELTVLFNDICRYNRVKYIELIRAPYTKNFSFGLGLAQEWAADGALEVPDGTILRGQMSEISAEHLDASVEERFYAINALRYIIASVERSPWEPPVFTVRAHQKRDPRGWT
jgi:hypothetical protein